jgi:hypothetical protein
MVTSLLRRVFCLLLATATFVFALFGLGASVDGAKTAAFLFLGGAGLALLGVVYLVYVMKKDDDRMSRTPARVLYSSMIVAIVGFGFWLTYLLQSVAFFERQLQETLSWVPLIYAFTFAMVVLLRLEATRWLSE